MNNALKELQERGFIKQCTNLEGLSAAMDRGPIVFYVGCDPTAPSLHIGHMVPFFAMRHLLRHGHRAITLLGAGTAQIGDPSGKTEMRQMLDYQQIDQNAQAITRQLDYFIGFNNQAAQVMNNQDWLGNLNYINFLRDIGVHFSVNRMLSFETYKKRLESGLSFIEFNYQLLQSYDFLQLYRRHGCVLQIGGDDQWGNIVAGIDLIRRVCGAETQGLTFPLVTTADGKKMGKTEKGALFLDPNLVSPYDFYQYWRNVADSDVGRFLLLFTFLPVSECLALSKAKDAAINEAKARLAFEVTALIHGPQAASQAQAAAKAAFGGGNQNDLANIPTLILPATDLANATAVSILVQAGLSASKAEARRLIEQGGLYINGQKVETVEFKIDASYFGQANPPPYLIRAGKKKWLRIVSG